MKLKYELALIAIAAMMLIGPALLWRRAPNFVREFFTATTSPVNLAVFRIVLFTTVLFSFSIQNVTWLAGLPSELRFPPAGVGFVLAHVPLNSTIAWYAAVALTVSCLFAIAGFFTRISIVMSFVLSLYVLGVPQLFGKMNHYHHLVWFMLILAVSPCADVLSFDAVRKSWKRADRGVTEVPAASVRYAQPLRFVWLLMGVIYFSAGFWKIWTGGFAWAWSDNPRNIMYNKWMELAGWTPLFRIDQYPLLFKVSALFTLAFELSFVFLIFLVTIRWIVPIAGLAFHNATYLFMRISFWNLQACYVAFVDWNKFFKWLGRKLFAQNMYLVYDGDCELCRRTVASFRVFDLLERITYVNALDARSLRAHELDWLEGDALLRDMHVIVENKIWLGFDAYREWMKRLPLFWIVVPFLYLWPVKAVGNKFYRHIADSRTCSIAEKSAATGTKSRSVFAVSFVGCLLIYVSVLCAVGKVQSWPFAGYPTFEDLDPAEVHLLTIVTESQRGDLRELRPVERQTLGQMPPEQLMGLQNRLQSIADQSERTRKLEAFWHLWRSEDFTLQGLSAERFYSDRVSSLPQDRNHRPIGRELIGEARASSAQSLTQNRSTRDETK